MSKKKNDKKGGKPKKTMFALMFLVALVTSGYFALGAWRPEALELLGQGRLTDAFHVAMNGKQAP